MPGNDQVQNIEPVASVLPVAQSQLPELPVSAYQEAPHLDDAPPRKRFSFGCGKFVIGIFVVVVVALILLAVLFAGLPANLPGNVSQPVSGPITSQPVTSAPIENPVGNEARQLDLKFAGIAKDGTIRIYDKQNKELVINLENQNWSAIQISPTKEYVSILSRSKVDSTDQNLQLYSFATGKWNKPTVYDQSTGGITGYYWIDSQTIMFTQAGWLHRFKTNSGEITKLVQVEASLMAANFDTKQFIFKSVVDYTVKPAVMKKIPDPNFRPVNQSDKAPLIEVVDTPAIIKHDNVFKVTDFEGNTQAGSRIDDLVELSGNFLLRNYYFTPEADKYLAEIVEYNPQTGQVGEQVKQLTLVSKDTKQPIAFPGEPLVRVIGLYGKNLLLHVLDKDQVALAVGIINFQRLTVFHAGYATPLTGGEKINFSHVVTGNKETEELVFIQTTEMVKGLPVVKQRWFTVDETERKLILSGPTAELLELAVYQQ